MEYKIARPVGEHYIPLSDKIERQLDSEWRRENSAIRSPHIAGGKYKFPDGTGKGWHGDTPGHKEAANRNKTAGVSRRPMKKKLSLKEKIIKKWEADLKARRSWSGNKQGFPIFDSNSGDDTPIEELSTILSKGQEGYDDYTNKLQEMNFDSVYEMFRATWAEFLEDERIDLDESGQDDDHEIMEGARMMFEENVDWNVEKFFEYDVLLIDSKRYDVDYEESGEVNESFKAKALKYISQKQFDEIIANSYGGSGYFGLIISARDVVEAIRENKEEVTGSDLVIGVHDGMNGSGYFVRAQAPYTITLKSARLDAGSYSIGDVFGHVDWKWR